MKTLHCSVLPGPFEVSGHGGLERPWRPFPGVTGVGECHICPSFCEYFHIMCSPAAS